MKDVSVMRKSDKFQGLILTIAGSAHPDSLTVPMFEVLFSPILHSRKLTSEEQTVWALEVRRLQ